MAQTAEAGQGTREPGGPEQGKPWMPDAGPRQALGKIMEKARVGTVFGEPINQDGVTVIPVARVNGKGGGGGGPMPEGRPTGRGGGFGMSTRPAGVFVISGGKVSWRPSVDVNKIIMGLQIVAGIALLTLRARYRSRTGEVRNPRMRRREVA